MIAVFLRKYFKVLLFLQCSLWTAGRHSSHQHFSMLPLLCPRPEGPRVTCAFKGTGSRSEEISSAPVATLLNWASLGYLPSFRLPGGLVLSVVLKGMYKPSCNTLQTTFFFFYYTVYLRFKNCFTLQGALPLIFILSQLNVSLGSILGCDDAALTVRWDLDTKSKYFQLFGSVLHAGTNDQSDARELTWSLAS